jgi:hypothetical protein
MPDSALREALVRACGVLAWCILLAVESKEVFYRR